MTTHPDEYALFEWIEGQATISDTSSALLLAGAGSCTCPHNPHWIGGRDAWSFDAAGSFVCEYPSGWALIGPFNGPYRLIWYDRWFHRRVTNVEAIKNWLYDQATTILPNKADHHGVCFREALLQVNLALWFVATKGAGDVDWMSLIGFDELETE